MIHIDPRNLGVLQARVRRVGYTLGFAVHFLFVIILNIWDISVE